MRNIDIFAISEVDINNTNEYTESLYNIPQYSKLFPTIKCHKLAFQSKVQSQSTKSHQTKLIN